MTLTFLREKDRHAINQILAGLRRPVYLQLYTSPDGDAYSSLARELLSELVSLHQLLHLELYDATTEAPRGPGPAAPRLPAIVVLDSERADRGISFHGLPSGHTFTALLETLLLFGEGGPASLAAETLAYLEQLRRPIGLQVFVTAAEEACPAMIVLAYQLAYASPLISAEAIEVLAFPELARQLGVLRTPTLVVSGRSVVAPLTEEALLLYLRLVVLA